MLQDLCFGPRLFEAGSVCIGHLRKRVLETFASGPSQTGPLRIWVPNCGFGYEAYIIAMELQETLRRAGRDPEFRVIGTDSDQQAIETASRGQFPAWAIKRLPLQRKEACFVRSGNAWLVDPAIRERVIFSPHDTLSDPPFVDLDLISCLSFQECFRTEHHDAVLNLFQFGLKPGGFLWLGPSLPSGILPSQLRTIDTDWGIQQKARRPSTKPGATLRVAEGGTRISNSTKGDTKRPAEVPLASEIEGLRSREALLRTYRELLDRFAPSAILMTGDGAIQTWFGQASLFVSPPTDPTTWTVDNMVHHQLRSVIAEGLAECRTGNGPTAPLRINVGLSDGCDIDCDVWLEPLAGEIDQRLILAYLDVSNALHR